MDWKVEYIQRLFSDYTLYLESTVSVSETVSLKTTVLNSVVSTSWAQKGTLADAPRGDFLGSQKHQGNLGVLHHSHPSALDLAALDSKFSCCAWNIQ